MGNIRTIQESRELYGIDQWGSNYYGINERGVVVSYPTAEEHLEIPIPDIIQKAREQGLEAPYIIRFPQIIQTQLERIHGAFAKSIADYKFSGKHQGVFPFKVNQRREFIDQIVSMSEKFDYGLEVGSKTELLAAMSYKLSDKALLVCNGFKDKDFIHLSYLAASMGKNVYIVVEGPDELELIMENSDKFSVRPHVGLRSRLYSKGSGKWEKSSGQTSKFGLTTMEILRCLDLIKKHGWEEQFDMLHFHIGSQITEIKRIKKAIKEASHVYAKIIKMGFSPKYLNIGGGVGVDYDGSKTSFQSSANYSLNEFASDVVYVIGEVCKNEGVECPNILTESGRIVAAHHSVIATDIREVQNTELPEENLKDELSFNSDELSPTERIRQKCLIELEYILDNISRKNFVEYYHDAIEYYEELFTLFNLGYLDLRERATGEQFYQQISHKALYFASFEKNEPQEFVELQKSMVSKYLANFSIFQSIPDAWAIDQLFPIMPLSMHEKKPNHKATIVDITCDSDGCIERFIDQKNVQHMLELHKPDENGTYYIGFFLVGAYQESLANEHNLFGAINEVDVMIEENANWKISKATQGDPIEELLTCRNYNRDEIYTSICQQILESAHNTERETQEKMCDYVDQQLKKLPYLGV